MNKVGKGNRCIGKWKNKENNVNKQFKKARDFLKFG